MAPGRRPRSGAQQVIAQTLHDLGLIAWFARIPDLVARIILNPER